MSNSIEYCQSVISKPYKSALMLEGLTLDKYKLLTKECTTMEEKYEEAVGVDKEVWAEKLKILQKLEEERKAVEKKEQEKQKAKAKQKKLDDLQKKREKEERDATKKLWKEQKKKEKAVKAVESSKGKDSVKVVEAVLVNEERRTDEDTEGEKLEASKEKALQKLKEKHDGKHKVSEPTVSTAGGGKKQKCSTKSMSMMVESGEDDVPGPSKKSKVKVMGPVENEEELERNKHCIRC
ncbi:uncharacterized protein ARMOST_11700 [Armillaria ostoyae]|uniref:Uncharacterized protein n=1 Tax=Armillaria ostoyae TaxID=47428 RepID=A0A284RHY8_ARMOS|nr:uncharacterized protein ARMOST_11700 [Armillaria ostoyae]